MNSIPPYPPSTIPPSEFYTPTPLPTQPPLPQTGTFVDNWVIVAAVVLVLIGVAFVIFRRRR
jgi:LPXTG-motif cell wall-anchored protein